MHKNHDTSGNNVVTKTVHPLNERTTNEPTNEQAGRQASDQQKGNKIGTLLQRFEATYKRCV